MFQTAFPLSFTSFIIHLTGINNGRYKAISNSSIMQMNNNSPSVVSQRIKSPPQQQQQVDKTQTRERGTSTSDEIIHQNDKYSDEVLHTPLHKTFTM